MFDTAEIRRSLRGALELLRGRAEGLAYFDLSVAGFWRSFTAILLVAPLYALDVAVGSRGAGQTGTAYFALKALSYLADWLLFPVLIAVLAKPLDFGRLYVPYIVAYNWSSVVIAALFAPATLLVGLGILGRGPAAVIGLALTVVAARYRFVIARTALQARPATALGLVLLEFLLSVLVIAIFDRLMPA